MQPAISPIYTATWFPGLSVRSVAHYPTPKTPPEGRGEEDVRWRAARFRCRGRAKFFGYLDGVLSFRRPTRRTWEAASIDLFQLFEISPKRTVVLARSELFERRVRPIERQGASATSLVNCG